MDQTFNDRGYEVCGALNKFGKPCQRIGKCPFHSKPNTPPRPKIGPVASPIKKGPYKQGWTKDEHIRFLRGLQQHGKGAWKEISQVVQTRTPTQIQVHAHRFFLRQQQCTKNKRSIHDFSLKDLIDLQSELDMRGNTPSDSSSTSPSKQTPLQMVITMAPPQLPTPPPLPGSNLPVAGHGSHSPTTPAATPSSSPATSANTSPISSPIRLPPPPPPLVLHPNQHTLNNISAASISSMLQNASQALARQNGLLGNLGNEVKTLAQIASSVPVPPPLPGCKLGGVVRSPLKPPLPTPPPLPSKSLLPSSSSAATTTTATSSSSPLTNTRTLPTPPPPPPPPATRSSAAFQLLTRPRVPPAPPLPSNLKLSSTASPTKPPAPSSIPPVAPPPPPSSIHPPPAPPLPPMNNTKPHQTHWFQSSYSALSSSLMGASSTSSPSITAFAPSSGAPSSLSSSASLPSTEVTKMEMSPVKPRHRSTSLINSSSHPPPFSTRSHLASSTSSLPMPPPLPHSSLSNSAPTIPAPPPLPNFQKSYHQHPHHHLEIPPAPPIDNLHNHHHRQFHDGNPYTQTYTPPAQHHPPADEMVMSDISHQLELIDYVELIESKKFDIDFEKVLSDYLQQDEQPCHQHMDDGMMDCQESTPTINNLNNIINPVPMGTDFFASMQSEYGEPSYQQHHW